MLPGAQSSVTMLYRFNVSSLTIYCASPFGFCFGPLSLSFLTIRRPCNFFLLLPPSFHPVASFWLPWPYALWVLGIFNSRNGPLALCVHPRVLLGCLYNKIKLHWCTVNPIGALCLPGEMMSAKYWGNKKKWRRKEGVRGGQAERINNQPPLLCFYCGTDGMWVESIVLTRL